jgi:5-methylcytosine-specific restriction protein A
MASDPGVRPRSRANAWLRDELILALDLYMRDGAGAPLASREELSATLRAFPIEAHLASNPTFRSLASVSTKLANFLAIDPSSAGGLTHGGAGDAQVWAEFSDDPDRLHQTAEAIRANLTAVPGDLSLEDDDDLAEAEEGRLLTAQHRRRERSRRLVTRKKAQALTNHGSLVCEACDFDFAVVYGERGDGFIECHHTQPLSDLRPGQRTRLADLALVCSNCHCMIHRRRPWLTIEDVRGLLSAT